VNYEMALAAFVSQQRRLRVSEEDLCVLSLIYAAIIRSSLSDRHTPSFEKWLSGLDDEDVQRLLTKDETRRV
jgi:hypothetical protein